VSWKILVLEDDPDLRAILAEVLGDEGYEVTTASGGEEAVAFAATEVFDLLVTDVRMPGVDGLEALEQLRSQQPGLESLVVSGYTTEAETLRALQLNVGGYLKKPFSLNDLLHRVRQLLADRARQKQRQEQVDRLQASLHWIVRGAAQSFCASAYEAGQLAYYLARRLELEPGRARQLRLAAILAEEAMAELHQLPPEARADQLGLGAVWELWHLSEDNLEKQILALVSWICRHEETPAPDQFAGELSEPLRSLWLAEGQGLRQSPQVLAAEALEEVESGQRAGQTGLLALAETLEQHGQLPAARQAYQGLTEPGSGTQTGRLRALLGLARTQWRLGDEAWYENLKQAELLSRGLGPGLALEMRWNIAKLLKHTQHASAAAYLQQLEADCGSGIGWARARLAGTANDRSGEAATLLLHPQQRAELDNEADWLVGALLSLAARLGPSSTWCRLTGEYPTHTIRWLQSHPDEAAVEAVLASLESHAHLAPVAVLEALKTQPQWAARAGQLQSRLSGERPPLYLRFRSFGYFEVTVNGQRIEERHFKTQKFRYMLAYLLAQRGQPVSEDVLVEEFWPNSKDSGKSSVYAGTTAIRRALRQGAHVEQEIVQREGDLLRLDPTLPIWHDFDEFDRGIAEFGQSAERDRQTVRLYAGPYLQGCYLDWALRIRSQCEEKLVRTVHNLATRCLEHDPQQALELTGQGLELDPLSQELHGLRMRAFLQAGQPENGIRQFQQLSGLLQRELGIEPLTSIIELFHRCKLALP
jgi:DNA-binding response OmpR family regulator